MDNNIFKKKSKKTKIAENAKNTYPGKHYYQ